MDADIDSHNVAMTHEIPSAGPEELSWANQHRRSIRGDYDLNLWIAWHRSNVPF